MIALGLRTKDENIIGTFVDQKVVTLYNPSTDTYEWVVVISTTKDSKSINVMFNGDGDKLLASWFDMSTGSVKLSFAYLDSITGSQLSTQPV